MLVHGLKLVAISPIKEDFLNALRTHPNSDFIMLDIDTKGSKCVYKPKWTGLLHPKHSEGAAKGLRAPKYAGS